MSAQRFRLIPTRGRSHRSWFVYGEQEAFQAARDFAAEHDMPCLLVEHPEGSHPTHRATISPPPKPKAKR